MPGKRSPLLQSLPKQLYSADQVAEALGVSRGQIYNMMARGEIDFILIGKRRMIHRDAIEELMGRPLWLPPAGKNSA